MRSKKEVVEKLKEIEDLCWLHRSYILERVPEFRPTSSVATDAKVELGIEANVIVQRHAIESKYGVKVPEEEVDLVMTEQNLTEQMAVLRWIIGRDWEWDEDGIRDT